VTPGRNIEIALRLAIGGFTAPLGAAAAQVRGFGADIKKASTDSPKDLERIGKGALVMGGLIGAGFALAVHAAVGFDKQMSEVAAVSKATGDELGELRQAALDAGQATVFSASEAARAQAELAKAGVSVQDILDGGLTGALNLAAAGNLDLATAAEIAAQAMTTFKLEGGDVPRIADTLAAAANESAADVDDMALAMKQAGLVAAQLDLTVEDTAGALALFAQNGLRGSDAGTSLRTMLMRLVPQSKEQTAAMNELGLSFFDAQGDFIGLDAAAQHLQDRMAGLTQEQRLSYNTIIFGQDAIRASNILFEAGGQGVRDWTEAVSQSGYAAELAAQKNDNLAGDLEQLKGAIETALIEGGSKATDALRGVAQGITSVITGATEMPSALQVGFLGATGLLGVGTSAIGIYGTLKPKLDEVKKSLNEMGSAGQFVGRNIGAVGGIAAGAAVGLGILAWAYGEQAKEQAEAAAVAERYAEAMRDGADATGELVDKQLRQDFADSGIGELLADTSADLDLLTRSVRESGEELEDWRSLYIDGGPDVLAIKLERAAEAGSLLARELLRMRDAGEITNGQLGPFIVGMDDLNDRVDQGAEKLRIENEMLGGLKDGLDGSGDAAAGAAPQLDEFGGEVAATGEEAETATERIEAYNDAVRAGIDPIFAMQKALRDNADALRDVDEASLEVFLAQAHLNEMIRQHGPRSAEAAEATRNLERAQRELTDANWKAADSALSVEEAANILQGLLHDQPGAVDAAKAALERWVTQGLLTEQQAADVAEELGIVIEKAKEAGTQNVVIPVELDIAGALVSAQQLDDAIREGFERSEAEGLAALERALATDRSQLAPRVGALSLDGKQFYGLDGKWHPVEGRAAGGPLSPWSVYRFHDTARAEVAEMGGDTLLFTGAAGGQATNLGDQPYRRMAETRRAASVTQMSSSSTSNVTSTDRSVHLSIGQVVAPDPRTGATEVIYEARKAALLGLGA
jgi:TP901 family phage tail tape measure protein